MIAKALAITSAISAGMRVMIGILDGIMGIEYQDFKLSGVCSDKKHGRWYAIGTKNYWFEFRITKAGKIRVYSIKKGKHPYFTIGGESNG